MFIETIQDELFTPPKPNERGKRNKKPQLQAKSHHNWRTLTRVSLESNDRYAILILFHVYLLCRFVYAFLLFYSFFR